MKKQAQKPVSLQDLKNATAGKMINPAQDGIDALRKENDTQDWEIAMEVIEDQLADMEVALEECTFSPLQKRQHEKRMLILEQAQRLIKSYNEQ